MDFLSTVLQLILAWAATSYLLTLLKRSKLNPKRQPPGPFPLPIVGNLLSFGTKPHKSLTNLAKIHGPLVFLKLGFKNTLVVSSPAFAKEVLKTRDAFFAYRCPNQSVTAMDHHKHSIALMPPNDARWRAQRRLCATEVFSSSSLDATQSLRRKIIEDYVSYVKKCCTIGQPVNIGTSSMVATLNTFSNTFFSRNFAEYGADTADEFKGILWNLIQNIETPNIADFFPMLKIVDPQGIKRTMKENFSRMIEVFNAIIKERLELRKQEKKQFKSDVLDSILDQCDEENELYLSDIPHFLTDLFIGGSDAAAVTTEWAMSELLRNPEKMKKAQSELNEVIGTNNPLEESDYLRLPYLRAVVKETFRLHPPAPFLVPRKISTDVKLGEFIVPGGTKMLINVWGIGRDPNLWHNADAFEPERFLDSTIDYGGNHYELLPFGSGRRVCPGIPLATRVTHWMLGSLIHSVNWKPEGGIKPENIDMDDKFGLSVQRARPLCAIPVLKA